MDAITEDLLHAVVGARPLASWLAPTAAALRARASVARDAGENGLAAELGRQAAVLEGGNAVDLLALGAALEKAERLEDAAACLGRAVQECPSSALPVWALARVLRRLGRFAQAEACLSHLLAINPADVTTRLALGEVRRELGDTEGALQALSGANRQVPSSEAVAGALAETWLQAGQPARARRVVERLPAAARTEPGVAGTLAEIALASGVPRQAAAVLSPLLKQGSTSLRHHAVAVQVAARAGRREAAWSWFAARYDGRAPDAARLLSAGASVAHSEAEREQVLGAIEAQLSRPLVADDRIRLLFARADLQDRSGDPAGAALSWAEGNDRLSVPFSIDEAWDRVASVQAAFPPPRLAGGSEAVPDRQAVIVVGAPGSGAGLVGSLLGDHPDVGGLTPSGMFPLLEETLPRYTGRPWPDCLEGLGRPRAHRAARSLLGLPHSVRGRRVVQLGAEGLFVLGAMPLLLPLCRVVLVHRSAPAQALSQYRRPLRGPGLEHASRLEDIASMDAVYGEMLSYWRYALPSAPVEVCLDEVLTDPADALSRLCRALHMSEAPGLSRRVQCRSGAPWQAYTRWLPTLSDLDRPDR